MPRRNVQKCVRRNTPADRLDHTVEINLVSGECFGPWDLPDRTAFARPWATWGDEITRRWIEGFPGSRPMAAYLLGEIAAPVWKPGPPLHWRPLRRIEGVDVVMPGNWHKQYAELLHLDGLGLIDDDEWNKAIERLDSADATYHGRYRSIYDEQEAAARRAMPVEE